MQVSLNVQGVYDKVRVQYFYSIWKAGSDGMCVIFKSSWLESLYIINHSADVTDFKQI